MSQISFSPVARFATTGKSIQTLAVSGSSSRTKLMLISTDVCHPAISNQLIWVYLSFNVFTDLYLISIPLPMLWKANLRPLRKLGLMILLSGGLFVVVCAILRSILIVTVSRVPVAGQTAVL